MYSSIFFNLVCVIVGSVTVLVARYFIPWMKLHIEQGQLDRITFWATKGTYFAQQYLSGDSTEKKNAVFEFLKTVRDEQKLPFTNEQLEILIEAAVKQMKELESVELRAVEEK